MIIISRCLERIGDHAVDIGEQTAYLVTGEFREFTDASHPERTDTVVRIRRQMRLALVPKTTEFYVLFTRAGENMLETARLAERRFREFPRDRASLRRT